MEMKHDYGRRTHEKVTYKLMTSFPELTVPESLTLR